MSYVKNAEDVKEFLPHGALMVQDNVPPIPLTSLSVVEGDNGPVLIGFSYPNKDFSVELNNVLPQKGGWLCFSRGKRIVLRPLDEASGETAERMMDGV